MVPGYEKVFNKHLETVDKAKSAKKAVLTRTKIDTVQKGRSLIKNILGVTGPLGVAAVTMAYSANKTKVDAFIVTQFNRVISTLKW